MNKDIEALVSTVGTNEIWAALKKFNEISPTLELTSKNIAHLLVAFESVEDMGAIKEVRRAIETWAEHNQNSAMDVLTNLLEVNTDQLYSIAPVITKVLSTTSHRQNLFNQLSALLNSSSFKAISAGIRSLSSVLNWNLESKDDQKILRDSEKLYLRLAQDDLNDGLLADISNCCFTLYSSFKNPDYILLKLAESNNPQVQYSIATGLWVRLKNIEHPQLFESLLMSLSTIDDSKKGLVSQTDRTLHNVAIANAEVVLKYFNKWIAERTLDKIFHLKEFKRTFETIIAHDKLAFETWITKSLLSKDSKFHVAVAEVLSVTHTPLSVELQFDREIISNIKIEDIKHLTFKTLGWINSKRYWRSLILSLLVQKIEDKESSTFLSSIFLEPILYHYPSTKEYLNSKKSSISPSVAKALKFIIKKSDAYFEAIEKLEHRQEFIPSEQKVLAYHKLQNKILIEGIKKNEGEDAFMNSVTTIDLKGGKYWFCKTSGTYSKKSELNTIEHGMEIARTEVINPIGWARIQYQFRIR